MFFTFKKYNNLLVKYVTEFLNEHQGWNYYHVQMGKHEECFPEFLILRYKLNYHILLTLWLWTSGIPTTECDTKNAGCQVKVTAFNGLPHADLIEITVFYSSQQAFNSSAKGLMSLPSVHVPFSNLT